MIRLPPTLITLVPKDLEDYKQRQKRKQEPEIPESRGRNFARFEVVLRDGPKVELLNIPKVPHESYDQPENASTLANQVNSRTLDQTLEGQDCRGFDSMSVPETQSEIEVDHTTITDSPNEHHGFVLVRPCSPENEITEGHQPSSPSKHDFHYGGFTESPSRRTPTSPSQISSLFAPEDVSTPQHLGPGVRARALPRSPLFRSHNFSSSPESRLTSSLTPRVSSRVATHNTPGIIFAQPARRPVRMFRHQTNSFSFDESDRSSAVYEQERISSTSTTNSRPRSSDDRSLHEELRGSSLQSSMVASNISSSPPTSHNGKESVLSHLEDNEQRAHDREFIFSSPQLPLPPPFSTTSRSISRAESLPTSEHTLRNPDTSPITSPSISPPRTRSPRNLPDPGFPIPAAIPGDAGASRPTSSALTYPRSILRSAARLLTPYRSRSPSNRRGSPSHPSPSTSASSSPTPRQGNISYPREQPEPQTPSRNYQVYNDSLPRHAQPQTPAHLPEARHQSRFHPSYTAPVTRGAARNAFNFMNYGNSARDDDIHRRVRARFTNTTPSRVSVRRSDSPVGLLEAGFRGLYGGRENGDEEQDWVDGVRFSNAEVRLWGLRDARGDGRSLRETPEREDWRISW